MRTILNKRDQSLNTYIILSQVFFFLMVGLLILRSSGLTFDNYFEKFPVSITWLYFLLALTPLLTKISMHSGKYEYYLDWFIVIIYIVVSSYLLIKEREDFFKIIFLMPVIMLALKYGVRSAFLAALFSAAMIIVISSFDSYASIDAAFVFSGVLFLLAWLLGKMTEKEHQIRLELVRLASFDELTNIYNHRSFHQLLDKEIEHAIKKSMTLSLMMLDIDSFKTYNDIFGHQKGDRIIHQIAVIISQVVGNQGICARYGGAEFAVIYPSKNIAEAKKICELIINEIDKYSFPDSDVFPSGKMKASMGLAEFPLHADNKKMLIKKADEALFRSKFAGKNNVESYFSVFEELSIFLKADEQELLNSISTFTMVINAKDSYTYSHSLRVMELSKRLAIHAGLDPTLIRQIAFGAILHDIGKIEIPRDVLKKSGKLTESEWNFFRQHPIWGADIIEPLKSLAEVKSMIHCHHENYNGTGYPDGIVGTNIPLGARILRIVDSFDAMTSNRSYKDTMSVGQALTDLAQHGGTLYDPVLLKCFLEMMEEEEQEEVV